MVISLTCLLLESLRCNLVSAMTSTLSPLCSASIRVSSSCIFETQTRETKIPFLLLLHLLLLLIIQHPTSKIHHPSSIISFLMVVVVVGCPALSSHRRIAKFSTLSGLKACIAAIRKGTARAARPGHTQVCAKLAAATAKHIKLQQCRRFTWQFASKFGWLMLVVLFSWSGSFRFYCFEETGHPWYERTFKRRRMKSRLAKMNLSDTAKRCVKVGMFIPIGKTMQNVWNHEDFSKASAWSTRPEALRRAPPSHWLLPSSM